MGEYQNANLVRCLSSSWPGRRSNQDKTWGAGHCSSRGRSSGVRTTLPVEDMWKVEFASDLRLISHIRLFFLPCGTPEDYNLLKFLLVRTENGFFHDTSFLAISVTSVAVANAAQRRNGCFWLAVYGDTGYCGGRQFPATWSVTLLAHLSADPEAVKGPDLSSFLISPLPRCQGPQPQALDGTAHR